MFRALLIHAGAIGDSIMALRVVAALRSSGYGQVVVLGRSLFAELISPPDGPDGVWDLDVGGFHSLFSDHDDIPTWLAEKLRGFDLAVDMLSGPTGKVPKLLASLGIPRVVAIDTQPRPTWERHLTEQWLSDLHANGLSNQAGPPRIRVPEGERLAAHRRLAELLNTANPAAYLLHPGSGGRAKCWPLKNFVALAEDLRSAGRQPVFLIGPVEQERFPRDEVERLRATAPLIESPPLRETAALTAAAACYIGNDSGIAHLAAATGTRTLVLFGPSNSTWYAPQGPQVTILHPTATGSWPSVQEVLSRLT